MERKTARIVNASVKMVTLDCTVKNVSKHISVSKYVCSMTFCFIVVCNCTTGAIKNSCSQMNGNCQCRAGYTGQKCDQCRSGFFNYPECQG